MVSSRCCILFVISSLALLQSIYYNLYVYSGKKSKTFFHPKNTTWLERTKSSWGLWYRNSSHQQCEIRKDMLIWVLTQCQMNQFVDGLPKRPLITSSSFSIYCLLITFPRQQVDIIEHLTTFKSWNLFSCNLKSNCVMLAITARVCVAIYDLTLNSAS